MKSIYQDEEFAHYWNSRAGNDGEDYKRFVLDPLMMSKIGSLKNKDVLEMGCGNGYMVKKFLQQDPQSVWMVDISEANLKHAQEKTDDDRVKFVQQDITVPWSMESESVDVVYSNMVLNEVPILDVPIQEVFRVLRKNGQFIFSALHPAYMLYFYAQQVMGVDSGKFVNLGGYFSHNDFKYIMGSVSVTKPVEEVEISRDFEVEQKQSTVSDYINQVIEAGFMIKAVYEPELGEDILEHNPGFKKYTDRPIGLVIHAVKI